MLFDLKPVDSILSPDFDCVVIVGDNINSLGGSLEACKDTLLAFSKINSDLLSAGATFVPCSVLPGQRLVFANSGPLNRDYDDIRRLYDAAVSGIKAALKAGSRKPVISLAGFNTLPADEEWASSSTYLLYSVVLGALHALYTPIEVVEFKQSTDKGIKVDYLGFVDLAVSAKNNGKVLEALENGRIVARDIGGSDPERMAAPRIVEYIKNVFDKSAVKVEIEDVDVDKYPLMAAVNRGSVDRHAGQVVHLSYEGEGEPDDTLLLVGKGITYDTGGADIKAGGHMAGMHRDKCGAAAVAGFFKTLADLKPPKIRVFGSMAYVRNSVGSNCYVSDEIITSRAGVRVRVCNTDAEGRMVMSDLVCLQKERALRLPDPSAAHIFTVATLTGHVVRAYGEAYSAVMDNGPARKKRSAEQLQKAGDRIADPFEVSTLRRDDFDFVNPWNEYEDVIQCNNEASSATPRGHQFPAVFMLRAAGMDKHGLDSEKPICYSHLDVAGSSGPYPGIPTGAPLLALAARYVLPKLIK